MNSHDSLRVIRFFLFFISKKANRNAVRRTFARSGFLLDLYEPCGKDLGTTIFVHGMSGLGREDPRIIHLAGALTRTGQRVLVPDFSSLRKLEIRQRQSSEILDQLQRLLDETDLVPDKVSLMAVSFSSLFALQAGCNDALSPRISALCLIGGYYDVGSVCSFLIRKDYADPYGRLLILRNYFREIDPKGEDFHRIVDRCILQCVEQKSVWNADIALNRSDALEGQIHWLLTSPVALAELEKKILQVFMNEWHEYDVNLDGFCRDISVFLIHGKDDLIVPSDESKQLARCLTKKKIPNYLCITRFLSHGDTSIRPWRWVELVRLLQGFFYFFRVAGSG